MPNVQVCGGGGIEEYHVVQPLENQEISGNGAGSQEGAQGNFQPQESQVREEDAQAGKKK